MKKFELIFFKDECFLESRQTNQRCKADAFYEASLYKAWAECHYKAKIGFNIRLINNKKKLITL